MRKNVDSLTENEVLALRSYLRQLEDDTSDSGFQVSLNPVDLELMIIIVKNNYQAQNLVRRDYSKRIRTRARAHTHTHTHIIIHAHT